ncbi:hypothetical protein ACWT_5075 [Actinoplanes sp. SE50]|uniref:hypothetical protein n=1 Tax=unclassified Actinoplanes TaxID=2626549 RepID=UPI00023ED0D6|nr:MULTISPECIES: hypothetical protein [unclassified Actinoplanes]AEV86092.1 hypothetical protein ACPL_5205 [Actinoplanes sp. SE50/110]ATO84490.1 hypothetical protein ACWT_5075 [Actinoplanes sp. SE50]SLM01900.1 hypothetical protein ACSP50_5138 [Actinoplanes sp. SE50/110]
MTTTLAHRPTATAAYSPPAGRLARRVADLRHHSPGRLQLILAGLLTLGLLTGLVAGLTAHSASAGTADLGRRAQPLMVEAETIYSTLADADTTAAQAFLAGGLEPAGMTQRYDDDLGRAGAALTRAARLAPDDSDADRQVEALATGISRYAALVATARANNRQNLPIGASYLAAASQLNRETLQPQAQALFRVADRGLSRGYATARSSWWLILLLVLFVALGIALVAGQGYLSRTTRRTFNVPMVAATALFALLALTTGVLFTNQRAHLDDATRDGSAPVAALAEIRIAALTERADEALTLGSRGTVDKEADFAAVSGRVNFDDPRLGATSPGLLDTARRQHAAYVQEHGQVQKLNAGGDYDGAVKAALSDTSARAFTGLTDALDRSISERRAAFADEIDGAGAGLTLLTVLGPLLALAACALVFVGIRARLEEYR